MLFSYDVLALELTL